MDCKYYLLNLIYLILYNGMCQYNFVIFIFFFRMNQEIRDIIMSDSLGDGVVSDRLLF